MHVFQHLNCIGRSLACARRGECCSVHRVSNNFATAGVQLSRPRPSSRRQHRNPFPFIALKVMSGLEFSFVHAPARAWTPAGALQLQASIGWLALTDRSVFDKSESPEEKVLVGQNLAYGLTRALSRLGGPVRWSLLARAARFSGLLGRCRSEGEACARRLIDESFAHPNQQFYEASLSAISPGVRRAGARIGTCS